MPDKAIDLVDEAGSRVRLRHAQVGTVLRGSLAISWCYMVIYDGDLSFHPLQLPEEARELERELRQITKEKNEAVRGQDFEKVKLDL